MQQMTYRQERRLDRAADAQIRREDEIAREERRLAAAEAASKLRRDEKQARRADRKAVRKIRAARWAGRLAWLREHVTALLFVPVIAVPGVLAWTAMAAYGTQLYSAPGVSLPAFSEGGMWVFAGATTIRRHRHPDRPVWHLRLGTAVFAGYGAALNFAHGYTSGSPLKGAVMALVSVAGVVAHQLITAGPRRSREERGRARALRAVTRRERTIARAAARRAYAVLDVDGNARLVHQAGPVELGRHWYGRLRLTEMPAPAEPAATLAPEVHSWPRPAPVLEAPVRAAGGAAREAPAGAVAGSAERAIEGPADGPRKAPSEGPVQASSSQASRKAAHVSSEPDAVRARAEYRKSVKAGKPLTDRALAAMFRPRSRNWAAARIEEAQNGPRPLAAASGGRP